MNNVSLIGRLTRDPNITYTQSQMCVARFSLAINRGKDKDGNDRGADYPNIVAFGKQAEGCEKYLRKGRKVAVQGHIQTGSYTNRDGQKVYTTDIIADRVEYLEFGDQQQNQEQGQEQANHQPQQAPAEEEWMNIPENIDEELPFC